MQIPRPFLANIILLVIASSLLAACQTATGIPTVRPEATSSGRTPTPAKTKAAATQTISPTATLPAHLGVDPASLRGIKVNFWHPWDGDLARETEELVNEFNRQNEWKITISARAFYGDGALYDAVNSALAQGEPGLPEVIAAPSEHLVVWAEDRNIVVDLNDYFDHQQLGMSQAERDAFSKAFWQQDQAGGSQVGVPILRSARVIFYNKRWAQDLGFSNSPKTPEEFKTQACAAAVANNSAKVLEKYGTGGWLVDNDPLTMLSWLHVFGAQVEPVVSGGTYQFKSEETQAALDFLHGMVEDGCAWLGRSPAPHDYFAKRMALFYTGSLQDLYIQKRYQETHSSQDEWMVLPFPSPSGDPVVYASGYALGMLQKKDAKAPEVQMASWLFLRWMSEPKNLAHLAELYPSLPVNSAVVHQFTDYQMHFPWDQITPLVESVRPAPVSPPWRMARMLLGDAAWQVFHLPAEQVDLILPQLEEIMRELLERQ